MARTRLTASFASLVADSPIPVSCGVGRGQAGLKYEVIDISTSFRLSMAEAHAADVYVIT